MVTMTVYDEQLKEPECNCAAAAIGHDDFCPMKNARRIVRVGIGPTSLGLMFTVGQPLCTVEKGLPKGAKAHAFQLDPITGLVYLIVEHESFKLVAEGSPVPEGVIVFRRVPIEVQIQGSILDREDSALQVAAAIQEAFSIEEVFE